MQLIETDISWILLTGDLAYKFKKAMRRDVLDYSSLAARRLACEEELRLNRRLAPELYLGVANIRGIRTRPSIDGDGPVLEVAVRMRRFAQSALWQARLDAGQLGAAEAKDLAVLLANFHAGALRSGRSSPWGGSTLVAARTMADLAGVEALLGDRRQHVLLLQVASWLTAQHQRLARVFARRKAEGWVRECHGDLHCGNILTLDGRVRVFDGIEFNAGLRWIDVAQDLAFIWMDLQCQGQGALAARLLNDYLERSGDYDSLAVLPYYRVQRALVRCKVALLRAASGKPGRIAALARASRYLAFAHACTAPGRPSLIITHGFSGSGKSWLCDALVEPLEAVRLRSDVERKRLHAKETVAAIPSLPGAGMYDRASNAATYRRLAQLARVGLAAGLAVLVDAAFLERERRLAFRRLARRGQAAFLLLQVGAPLDLLRARLVARARSGGDPSDADHAVLAYQMAYADAQGVRGDEAADTVAVVNDAGFGSEAVAALALRLRERLQRRAAVLLKEQGSLLFPGGTVAVTQEMPDK
ncbi:AAA family ATPase [Janthinobacterium sp. FT14W]|uniref:bifunctional aminoglycoside phosphotransferase/ATP-binding protein n=1 Tax=Janthinobacterium sp. FT14W TaxID=2654253 RepID=UPI0012652DB9|nr:bifunctional aminoglycoside phosphotransferase/ATP-binding protein [Janthinobacterium sp. FT14W]KAB8050722.1 AAA family ATPase [Janthinobacterium sp. FT14W]